MLKLCSVVTVLLLCSIARADNYYSIQERFDRQQEQSDRREALNNQEEMIRLEQRRQADEMWENSRNKRAEAAQRMPSLSCLIDRNC